MYQPTKTLRAGLDNVKMSANPDHFITNIFLTVLLYPHIVLLSIDKKVKDIKKSKVE